jgi:hypothetical protein
LGQVLRLRVRHMSDGVALGTRAFVNEVFTLHREKFGAKRKDGARPIRALASIGLMALRDLRVRPWDSVAETWPEAHVNFRPGVDRHVWPPPIDTKKPASKDRFYENGLAV